LLRCIGRIGQALYVYPCGNCGHWAVGTGWNWCSDPCRHAGLAARDRKRTRAKWELAAPASSGPLREVALGPETPRR
jgi:hypothetical protein